MSAAQYRLIDYRKTLALCERIFAAYGFEHQDARCISDVLLRADLFGIESHGIQRLMRYHKAIRDGEVDISATPALVHETPVSAVIDAKRAMGQVVSRKAMELAIDKARAVGIGMVAVRNSNHYGIAGYYSLLAAQADLIGVCMTNTEAIMVPTFGRQGLLGTNPIAVAMPADPRPFSFDAATTVVPRGKLEVYTKRGEALPEGWGLDADGRSSTDAAAVLANIIAKAGGGIAPLGGVGETGSGYKGYGFGMVCELFTSVMAGGLPSHKAVDEMKNLLSHGFWAIDYGIFGDKGQIREAFSTLLADVRGAPKAQGQQRIYIHGEKEFESEALKRQEGLPVNQKTFEEIHAIAGELGIDAREYIGGEF